MSATTMRTRPAAWITSLLLLTLTCMSLTAQPAQATEEPQYGMTVVGGENVEPGDTVTITGTLPAQIDGTNTGVYAMWCLESEGRPASQDCGPRSTQKWLMHTSVYGQPTVGSVTDGIWTFETTYTIPADAIGETTCTSQCGLFLRLDHNFASTTDYDTFVPVTFAQPAPVTPQVTVSRTTGLDGQGDTITVSGTGFLPASDGSTTGKRPPLAGKFTGIYIAFGKYADAWQPSAGASSSSRTNASTKWAVPAESVATIGGAGAGAIELRSDGTFSTTLDVSDFAPDAGGTYGVYTYAGGGATYAPFETSTPLAFADPEPEPEPSASPSPEPEPSASPSPEPEPTDPTEPATPGSGDLVWGVKRSWVNYIGADGIAVSNGALATGDTFTFTSTGGDANLTAGTGTATFTGTVRFRYAAHGIDVAMKDPHIRLSSSTDAMMSLVVNGTRVDFARLDLGASPRTAGADTVTLTSVPATLTAAGSAAFGGFYAQGEALDNLSVTLGASEPTAGGGDSSSGGSAGGSGSTGSSSTGGSGSSGGATSVTDPPRTSSAVVGRLTWGISSQFRSYVTGPIAKGQISVAGASTAGSAFSFVQTGGKANPASGTGTASYGGSVRFTGHNGALDYTFANPRVRLTSPSTAVLSVSVNGSRKDFATLNLAFGTRTTLDGGVRYSHVPATPTAAGQAVLSGPGGQSMSIDPVTVTFGVAGSGTSGTSRVVQTAATTTDQIPATAPATTGIDIDDATLASLIAGDIVTITASGFEPHESGIKVVVYSTPTVLADNLTADAQGNVTWTGSLPASLTGEHTLTFQGSQAVGIVLTIPATPEGACMADATLTWGFKESFRAYLESTIANGEWTLDAATEDGGLFTWTNGSLVLDPEDATGTATFTGSVAFTGHDGALAMTVANPVVEMSADGAYLLLSVMGSTQDGAEVNAEAIRFARLDLDAAQATSAGTTVTLADIPATLTAEGAAAFGTYPEGEALDPVTLTTTSDDGCAGVLAGVEPTVASADPTPEPSASAVTTQEELPGQGSSVWVWIVIAVVLIGAAATAIVVVARRRD